MAEEQGQLNQTSHASRRQASQDGQMQESQKGKNLKIRDAVLYITEGEKNDVFLQHPHDEVGVLSYYIIHNPVYCSLHLIVTLLLMLLALFERPAVFPVAEGEIQIHAPIEMILLLLLALDIILRAFWLRKKFVTHRTVLIALFLAVMFVEAVVVIINHQSHIRVTRSLRPFFFIDTYLMSETRRTLRNIGNCLKEIVDVLLVLLFMIAIFALMGYYLFAQYNPDYLSTVGQSFVSLFITLTTANHPDVMLESYKLNGWSAVFFIIFLVITFYLLTNVLLGVVYGSFTHASKKKFEKKFKHWKTALKKAYHSLTGNDQALDADTFIKLMLEYKPLMPMWQILCTLKALQKIEVRREEPQNGTNRTPGEVEIKGLTLKEFYHLYEALDFKWIPPKPRSKHPCEGLQDRFSTVVKSCHFKIFLTLVAIANALFLFIYIVQVPSGNQCHDEVLWVSFLFVAVYCIEVAMKIIACGYKYFTKIWNWIDLAIIFSSLVMLFLEINYCKLIFFRPVILIRLFWLKGRYQKIMKAIAFLMGKIISAIMLLLVVYYVFAIIGMEAFPTVLRSKCCDYNHTWYGVGEYYSGTMNTTTTNVYWSLNFHTNIMSSFITLFVLMVVNNWYIVMEGFAAEVQQQTSVHHAWLTRLYFMSFYIITLVVLQVSVAFILDAFANARKINKLLSKKSRTNKNSCCCNQMNNELGGPANKEPKPSIVNAYYDSMNIVLSCEEVKKQDEQPPAEWWKYISYYIRMWRRIDFKSRKLENQLMSRGVHFEITKEGYFCMGERERGKDCLDLQLYSDKFKKWERQSEEEPSGVNEYGDLLVSVCCHLCDSCCCQKCTDEKTNEEIELEREELCKRFTHFFKGVLEFIFG